MTPRCKINLILVAAMLRRSKGRQRGAQISPGSPQLSDARGIPRRSSFIVVLWGCFPPPVIFWGFAITSPPPFTSAHILPTRARTHSFLTRACFVCLALHIQIPAGPAAETSAACGEQARRARGARALRKLILARQSFSLCRRPQVVLAALVFGGSVRARARALSLYLVDVVVCRSSGNPRLHCSR